MNMPRNDRTALKPEISAWLSTWLSRELEMPEAEIDVTRSLMDYGLSSIIATMLVGELEDRYGLQLPVTLAWDYPTIEEMAGYLWTRRRSRRHARSLHQTVGGVARRSGKPVG